MRRLPLRPSVAAGGAHERPDAALDAPSRSRALFWLICLSSSGNFVAQGLLYTSLPVYLTDELGTSAAVAGLTVSAMWVVSVASRPWAGSFIDRRGRRPLLVAGPLVIVASAVGLWLWPVVGGVVVFRLAQGVANSFVYSAGSAAAADVAPDDRRARYLGVFSVFFYVGYVAGPFLAETLMARASFTAVWLAVGVAGAGGFVAALGIPETADPHRAPPPRRSIVARLFHPAAVGPGLAFVCIGAGFASVLAFLSLYARDLGLAGSQGLFLVLSGSVLLTRAFIGTLVDRFGRFAIGVPSVGAAAVGLALLAVATTTPGAVAALVIFGLGFSGAFPALFALVVDRASPSERGAAMSSFNVFFDLGAPAAGFLTGVLVDAGGFGLGFGAMAGVAAVGLVLLVGQMLTARRSAAVVARVT